MERPSPAPTPSRPEPTPEPAPTASQALPSPLPPGDPFTLVDRQQLLSTLEDLTDIQPYSGWRNSASQGEAEALDYVALRLGELPYLQSLGLEIERQSFHVFLSTELWESQLHLTLDGKVVEVPADGIRGSRDDVRQALRFDSDGALNDRAHDPVVVEGPVVLLRTANEIDGLQSADLQGRVVFLDYAAIDGVLLSPAQATEVAKRLVDMAPAGFVLVTQFSNQAGESHGTFVGDINALSGVTAEPAPPTLYIRLEDLVATGIESWDDLARVEAARLLWDADVFSPGSSGNLIARIPGRDASQAVILGAHIDSPNSPGALDDGSGSAVLLEVARVLDAARVRPPTDLYLVWFGSEELGLYGSCHFVSTHQELLDRTLAMLQIDAPSYPLDGINAYLNLVAWSYGRLGDGRLVWPEYLAAQAEERGVETYPVNYYGIESDNTAFTGFDVPSANLIYMDFPAMESVGGLHYAGHMHDPYDTVQLAREVADLLAQMAEVALAAALDTGQDKPSLRVTTSPDRRALFIASHTEPVQMSPTTLTELGMALAWEGFDVDLVPYGQPASATDLEGADVVVVLPVVDYPAPDGDPTQYDTAWSQEEIAAFEAYLEGGGFLVLTNSAHRLKYSRRLEDANEDWSDVNALSERFGVSFQGGSFSQAEAVVVASHPLVQGLDALALAEENGVPFRLAEGLVLARAGLDAVVALVQVGKSGGQLLVLGDVGLLSAGSGEPENLVFWRNLAQFAQSP